MTAAGRINASQVTEGTRVLVKIERNDSGLMTGWSIARTKTGEDVMVARVTDKVKAAGRRGYFVRVSVSDSDLYMEPIQTMWLAPEDAAGIKRAHAEALAVNEAMTAAAVAQAEMDEAAANQATPQYRYFAEATRVHGGYASAMRALEIEAHAELADRNWSERSAARVAAPITPQGYLDALAAKGQMDALAAGYARAEAELGAEARANSPEVAQLRIQHKTAGPFRRARIEARLAYLGAVLYPIGTPEYAAYATELRAALAAPGAWDFLDC